jgi:NitT/TauT family transport system ATP-binding protein
LHVDPTNAHSVVNAGGAAPAAPVYVLTAGPATVKSVYPIDLPRPRVVSEIRYDPRFIEISHTIWNDLRDEVRRGAARDEAKAA